MSSGSAVSASPSVIFASHRLHRKHKSIRNVPAAGSRLRTLTLTVHVRPRQPIEDSPLSTDIALVLLDACRAIHLELGGRTGASTRPHPHCKRRSHSAEPKNSERPELLAYPSAPTLS